MARRTRSAWRGRKGFPFPSAAWTCRALMNNRSDLGARFSGHIGLEGPCISDTLDFAGGRITHLSKGAGTTTTVWSLHLVGANSKHASLNSRDAGQAIFTSQAMHASVVLAWLSTLCFRGAHLSNFILWSSNPFETSPAGKVIHTVDLFTRRPYILPPRGHLGSLRGLAIDVSA